MVQFPGASQTLRTETNVILIPIVTEPLIRYFVGENAVRSLI
jgi:hypothetical protein